MGLKQIVMASMIAVVGTACSDYNLSPIEKDQPNAASKGSFCTYDPIKKSNYVNYLFILDFSGSNTSQGTDPNKIRVQKSREFYDKKKTDPFTRWGGLKFNASPDAVIYENSQNEPVFTDDAAVIERGFGIYNSTGHSGATNYEATLVMAKNGIKKDILLNNDRGDAYMIFFITDGEPTAGNSDQGTLVGLVKEIVALSPGNIFLSTAYYGNIGSPDLLKKMAEAGNGNYVEVETDGLDFADLVPGQKTESWILKNDAFMVYNLNSAPCEAKGLRFDVDSDGDGLCDLDEDHYNGTNGYYFDATKRSTPQKVGTGPSLVDTGYGDLFQLAKMKGKVTLPPCNEPADRLDVDNDLLNKCEEQVLRNQTPFGTKYKNIEWMSGNPKDPDTDSDGIIDGLDLFMFRDEVVSPFGWALDNRVDKDWDFEGTSAFKQAQQHRNPLSEDRGTLSYDPVLTPIPTDDGKSCFDYEQSTLTLYNARPVKDEDVHPLMRRSADANTVLVYFVQTKFDDQNGKGIYMHSFQQLKVDENYNGSGGTSVGLVVNDRVFTPYETYKKIDE